MTADVLERGPTRPYTGQHVTCLGTHPQKVLGAVAVAPRQLPSADLAPLSVELSAPAQHVA